MIKYTSKDIKAIAAENADAASEMAVQMVKLEVVQGAVANLLERIDEVVHKGWDKDGAMAYLAIAEIQDTVRLIDMAFQPLLNQMQNETSGLSSLSGTLVEMSKNMTDKNNK